MPPLLHNNQIDETAPGEEAKQLGETIVRAFNPRSVLDAGYRDGELLQALRAKGVEAHGLALDDDSADLEVEVQNLRETGLPKAPLGQEYDLIVLRRALFSRPNPERVVENLCARGRKTF